MINNTGALSGSEDDFRVRAARQKRERMHARLLEATMRVCAEKRRTPVVIDEVAQAAGVSRGTFYKYFDTLEKLIQAVGTKLSDELTAESIRLMPEVPSGMQSTAAGVRILLSRAARDHTWGRFVIHSDFLPPNSAVGRRTREDLAAGSASGMFVFARTDVAFDLVMGSVVEGIRRVIGGVSDSEAYTSEMTVHILQALGVPRDTAHAVTAEILSFVRRHAPERLTWWNLPVIG